MAESLESQDYRRNNNHHPQQTYYRGSRGRGRGGHVNNPQYTLNRLGVSDLREHLNRNREEKDERNVPPPDPSYNYLKDPSRETYPASDNNRAHSFRPSGNPHRQSFNKQHNNNEPRANAPSPDSQKDHQSRGRGHNKTRGQSRGRGKPQNQPATYIENPCNIKVEVNSTGDRSYTLDESTKLPNIKHMPDNSPQSQKNFQNYVPRGRGSFRGRGRGGRNYNTRTIRQKNKNENNNNHKEAGDDLQIECKNEPSTSGSKNIHHTPQKTNNNNNDNNKDTDDVISVSTNNKNRHNKEKEEEEREEYNNAYDPNETLKDYNENEPTENCNKNSLGDKTEKESDKEINKPSNENNN